MGGVDEGQNKEKCVPCSRSLPNVQLLEKTKQNKTGKKANKAAAFLNLSCVAGMSGGAAGAFGGRRRRLLVDRDVLLLQFSGISALVFLPSSN